MAATYDTTPADVARVIPARTRAGGGLLGSFTDDTNPTADQVEQYIEDAATDIEMEVGEELDDDIHDLVRRVIALDAAKRIELGAEDFDQERYDRLDRELTAQFKRLVEAAQDADDGTDPGKVDDLAEPLHSFPPSPCDLDEIDIEAYWRDARRV